MPDPKAFSAVEPPPVRRTDMTVHELDGEALMYDEATGDTHHLNETALFIWRQCDGRQDARRIARGLAKRYDVSLESAVEHVERMLRELAERQLVLTDAGG